MNRILAAAALALALGAPIAAHADTPHETTLKSIPDRAAFGRVFFETIRKTIALNDPDAVSTFCVPASGQMPAYCETTYEIGDAQDTLQAIVDVDSFGKAEKSLSVYRTGVPGLYLEENGHMSLVDSKAHTNQTLHERYPSQGG
jgi:hypothetical protein